MKLTAPQRRILKAIYEKDAKAVYYNKSCHRILKKLMDWELVKWNFDKAFSPLGRELTAKGLEVLGHENDS